MHRQLPLLADYRSTADHDDCQVGLVLVTHVLPTSVEYIQALAEDFRIEAILAISYSYDDRAGESLSSLPVVRCADPADIERNLDEVVSRCSRSGRPFVVQEIGGYFAQMAADRPNIPGLLGVVEDTRQGHWRYLAVDSKLSVPVLSIAESPLKALEHHQIGRAIVHSVERQIRSHFFRSLSGESVAVIGFGDIGSAAAHAFRGRNALVSVYDIDPQKRASAWMQNFRVGSLHDITRHASVIIGCSGSESLGSDILMDIPDGTLVASGSSRQVEIDLDYLNSMYTRGQVRGDIAEYIHGDRRIYLANEGKPINFLDGSAIGATLDLVYTELYACTRMIANQSVSSVGVQAIDQKERDAIVERWLEFYTTQESDVRFRFIEHDRELNEV